MTQTALPEPSPLYAAAPLEEVATPVLLVEWLVKQQQLLKQQQHVIEEQQRQISVLQKENEELKDSLDHHKPIRVN